MVDLTVGECRAKQARCQELINSIIAESSTPRPPPKLKFPSTVEHLRMLETDARARKVERLRLERVREERARLRENPPTYLKPGQRGLTVRRLYGLNDEQVDDFYLFTRRKNIPPAQALKILGASPEAIARAVKRRAMYLTLRRRRSK